MHRSEMPLRREFGEKKGSVPLDLLNRPTAETPMRMNINQVIEYME